MQLLLDTCAALWIAAGEPIAAQAGSEVTRAIARREPVLLSPISAWEVGLLVSRGRLTLGMTPVRWWQRLLAAPGLELASLDAEILLASSFLPNSNLRDPGDRIIVATAREHGYRIVTRDRIILDYAGRGLCHALPC